MAQIKEQKIITFLYEVHVTKNDIGDGKCRDPHKCMERIANLRALETEFGESKIERLRLDGAQIKFNLDGYRWTATTPKTAKVNLIRFDAKKEVMPHHYKVRALRGTKIQKASAERQQRINAVRRARIAAGISDKKPTSQSLHQRVVGLGAV